MATVPTIEPGVNPQGLPNARFDSQLPKLPQVSGDIGSGVAKSASGLVSAASDFFEAEKKKADEVKSVEVRNRLAAAKNRLLYDPEKGALNKRGKDAFGLHETVSDELKKEFDDIETTLSNESQRAEFYKYKQAAQADIDNDLNRHTAVETRRYDEQQTTGAMEGPATDASIQYLDRDRTQKAVDEITEIRTKYGQRNGEAPEYTAAEVRKATSKVHVAVMSQMLVNDMAPKAEEHFKLYGETMEASDRTAMAKSIESGTTLKKAQDIAVELTRKHSTISAVMKEIDASQESAQVKEKAIDLAKERFSMQEQGKKQFKDNLFERFSKKLEQVKDFDVVQKDPSYWSLDDSQRKALRSEWKDIIDGPSKKNDDEKWTEFLFLNQGQLASMSRSDYVTKYRSHLSEEYKTKADAKIDAAQNADAKNQILTPLSEYKDQIETTLRANNQSLDKKSPVYNQLIMGIESAMERMEKIELGGKRRATSQERQQLIDKLAIQKMFIEGRIWDSEKRAGQVTKDDAGKAYIPMSQIPPDAPARIQYDLDRALKAGNWAARKLSKREIEKAYAASILGKEAYLDLINRIARDME